MGCEIGKNSTETLPENEIEEVSPAVGNSITKETTPVTMGYVAVL